jgi:Tfp pilus assembly protein PilN
VTADVDTTQRLDAAPRVNLLPAWVAERRLVRRQRLSVAAGFVALLCLLALLWLSESARVQRAQRAAAGQRAVTAQLEAERAKLQPWADLQAQVVAAEQLRAKVYARELRFSGVLQDVATLMPDNAWLTQLTAAVTETQQSKTGSTPAAAQNGGAAAQAVPGAPGFGSPVGTITFSGMALGHVDVGRVVRVLDGAVKRNGGSVYLNPYYTSSQKQAQGGQTTVTFSASVDLGPAAFSGRFQRPGATGGR